jgi:hypothetical protein
MIRNRPLRHPAHEARPDAARLPLAVPASQRWPALAPFRTRSFPLPVAGRLGNGLGAGDGNADPGLVRARRIRSVVMLTVFGALMFVGTLLAPLMGTLGDRLGLRRVLATMRLSYALLASVILWLAATGRLEPSLVLGVAFLVGLIKPATSACARRWSALRCLRSPPGAGHGHLTHHAGLGAHRRRAGRRRLHGQPGHGQRLCGDHVPPTCSVRSSRCARLARGASPVAGAAPSSAGLSSPWRDLQEGLLYVWHTPQLRAAMLSGGVGQSLCVFPLSGGLMPYIARDVFQLDQRGLGWLVASFAFGRPAGLHQPERHRHPAAPGPHHAGGLRAVAFESAVPWPCP